MVFPQERVCERSGQTRIAIVCDSLGERSGGELRAYTLCGFKYLTDMMLL